MMGGAFRKESAQLRCLQVKQALVNQQLLNAVLRNT